MSSQNGSGCTALGQHPWGEHPPPRPPHACACVVQKQNNTKNKTSAAQHQEEGERRRVRPARDWQNTRGHLTTRAGYAALTRPPLSQHTRSQSSTALPCSAHGLQLLGWHCGRLVGGRGTAPARIVGLAAQHFHAHNSQPHSHTHQLAVGKTPRGVTKMRQLQWRKLVSQGVGKQHHSAACASSPRHDLHRHTHLLLQQQRQASMQQQQQREQRGQQSRRA